MSNMPTLRDILNGTAVDATDVEFNFNTIESHIDEELIAADGSVSMAAALNLVGGDPTLPAHATRKDYVDAAIATLSASTAASVAAINTTITPTAWTAVTFQNGWVNYGAGYQTVQYRKVGDLVSARGLAKDGTTGFVPAFTLPVNFRPPATLQFEYGRTTPALAVVNTDGTVQPALGTNTGFWFDFTFSVTA